MKNMATMMQILKADADNNLGTLNSFKNQVMKRWRRSKISAAR